MILKAEGRTVSSMLNARSQAQLRDVMSSAWKRANIHIPASTARAAGSLAKSIAKSQRAQRDNGISSMPDIHQDHQHQMTSPHSAMPSEDLAVMIASHSKILAQIVDMVALPATKQEISAVTSASHQISTRVDYLHAAVSSLETRISTWQTSILPQIVDRLPEKSVKSQTSSANPSQSETPFKGPQHGGRREAADSTCGLNCYLCTQHRACVSKK